MLRVMRLAILVVVAGCSSPTDVPAQAVNIPITVEQLSVPRDSATDAIDLDGDGDRDGQLGNIMGALAIWGTVDSGLRMATWGQGLVVLASEKDGLMQLSGDGLHYRGKLTDPPLTVELALVEGAPPLVLPLSSVHVILPPSPGRQFHGSLCGAVEL